ncbi:hypothetical protein [Nocardia farcinica]|uniref:hypothetical protein n=1 Tax=Nocardia farcinica TaxID=37329 RepID=UPI0024537D16|nr:hypothetical protein [Nocardia farcinica]
MQINDTDRLTRLLTRGAVTADEADAMRRPPSPARDLADTVLLRLCMQPLGEAAENLFVPAFMRYARLLQREPVQAVGGLAPRVAAVLKTAAAGLRPNNAEERSAHVLRILGGPSGDARQCAMNLAVRVFAYRIRDRVTPPVVGAESIAGIAEMGILPTEPVTAEIIAIQQARQVSQQWIDDRAKRPQLDNAIIRLASTVIWPPDPSPEMEGRHNVRRG